MEKTIPSHEWVDLTELEENVNMSICPENGDTGVRSSRGQHTFSKKWVFQALQAVELPSQSLSSAVVA